MAKRFVLLLLNRGHLPHRRSVMSLTVHDLALRYGPAALEQAKDALPAVRVLLDECLPCPGGGCRAVANAARHSDLLKWMFLYWAGTALTVIGLLKL